MTRNTSQRYTLAEAFEFFRRAILLDLMTGMPGEVIEYDAPTRRAKVRGSLKLVLEDGKSMQRSQIHDVPVEWPQIGGYILHMDLRPGDRGWLSFSQRDLGAWKEKHEEVEPGPEGLLSEKDAVFYPTFGPGPDGDPLVPQGKASLQTQDGRFSVHLDADAETVTVKAEDTTAVFDPDDIHVHADRRIRMDVSTHGRRVTIDNSAIHVQAGDYTDFAVSAGAIAGSISDNMGTILGQFLCDASHCRWVSGTGFIDITSGTVDIVADVISITGILRINGQLYEDHTHSGVEPGAGNTGGVN